MSSILKKFASAFVEIEENEAGAGEMENSSQSASLEDITADASELLAQLEPQTQRPADRLSAEPKSGGSPKAGSASLLAMTADEVFRKAGLSDNPNSAERILKLIGGLSMFPPEQQVVMVRAMDTADDHWSETEVLDDARDRQASLRKHLQAIEKERADRMAVLDGKIKETKVAGKRHVDEIDAQIADLQKQRENVVVEITSMTANFEQEQKVLEDQAETARHGITHVINALSNLMSFFTGNAKEPSPGN